MSKLFVIVLTAVLANLCVAADGIWQWDFENIQQRNVPPSVGKASGKLFPAPEQFCKVVPGISGQGLEVSGAKRSDRKVGGLNITGVTVDWTKSFTMIIWVKFSPLLSGKELYKENKVIIGNCGVRGPGWLLYITWGRLHLRSGDGKKSFGISMPFDGFGRWRQLGVVYDGQQATIYVDGVKAVSGKIQITPAARKNIFVGSSLGSNSQIYGVMDNLIIAERPFSEQEIAANYAQNKD